ncbi:MAG TPA: P63C domain-containing protein [Chthoniobacterales bacterium]|nr:P63C domain-containing protein [Chthoniobacterales bacterium]
MAQQNSAEKVVAKFGGQNALAKLIGRGQSAVQYWVKVGRIPEKWHPKLFAVASEQGIKLEKSDFKPMGANGEITSQPSVSVLPTANWMGTLEITEGVSLPCYVLNDGRRVISRTGATQVLTENKGGGNLENYLKVAALAPHLPATLPDQAIQFQIPGVVNKTVIGYEAGAFLDICRAYVSAQNAGDLGTKRQLEIAAKSAMFLAACAKVGLIALIDEATGYQYAREDDALRFKLRVFLEEEMRQWEKTFPDQLWHEFGRLTRWTGSVTQRPKYWGKLVMELIYEYLDADVAAWLRENAPQPRHGSNYHQWMSNQFGLKKLIEHIWMVIGMAKACETMQELRDRMAYQFGRQPFQLTLYLPGQTGQRGPTRNT